MAADLQVRGDGTKKSESCEAGQGKKFPGQVVFDSQASVDKSSSERVDPS